MPREAGAAIIVRDGAGGLEVLLGRRTDHARFLPGFWVFPGGRVERTDDPGDGRWRAAAVREAREEVGLGLEPASLVPFDRWCTPAGMPIRFDTAFFLAPAPVGAVPVVDGAEIIASRWVAPRTLLAEAEAGAEATMRVLTFPTLEQVRRLARSRSVAEAVAACPSDGLPERPSETAVEVVDGRPTMLVVDADGVPRRFWSGPVRPGEQAHGWTPPA